MIYLIFRDGAPYSAWTIQPNAERELQRLEDEDEGFEHSFSLTSVKIMDKT